MLRRLEERGVAVPGTVSVTGFDDVFGSDFCHPPLTTVATPTEEAGAALVDVLLDDRAPDHAVHGAPDRVVLPARLRVRDSTGPGRASDAEAVAHPQLGEQVRGVRRVGSSLRRSWAT